MSWQQSTLGDLIELENGYAFKSDEYTDDGHFLMRIANVQQGYISMQAPKFVSIPQHSNLIQFELNEGDMLMSLTGNVGRVGLIEAHHLPAALNQRVARVKIKNLSKIDKGYLFSFFNTDGTRAKIENLANGAAQLNVSSKDVKSLTIPLPPLAEQKRIAAILDKADEIRRKREQTIAKLDQLAQSIFVEMFGDAATNPKKWTNAKLGDLIFSASDGPHVSPKYVENGIPFLSTRHVRPSEIIWKDLKYISVDDAAIHWKKCKPSFGDILYSKGGTTGYAAVVRTYDEFAIWVHIALLKPDFEKCNSVWLEYMLNSPYCYRQSQELTHGIANRDLGLKRMVNIAMYHPPLTLQKEFASRINKLEQLKADNVSALAKQNQLFASLQHQAFTGNL